MAGPNKTYPAILGMVGLSLHLGNQIAAMDYEKRASEAIQRGALDYSLVSISKTERKYKMLAQELACFCFGFLCYVHNTPMCFGHCELRLSFCNTDCRTAAKNARTFTVKYLCFRNVLQFEW